jgi:hypothetical protein
MSKTLPNILTVFKVVRIIAKIVFILCIIGGVGCLLGLTSLPMVGGLLSAGVLAEEGLALPSAYLGCIVGFISCAGEAIFAFLAERYFKSVLNAGTPFTFESAKEIFRLGIISIIISAAIAVISGIAAFAIYLFSAPTAAEFDSSASISVSTGLVFLFLSMIFKHGAEIQQAYAEKTYAENNFSEEAKQEEQKSSEFESL